MLDNTTIEITHAHMEEDDMVYVILAVLVMTLCLAYVGYRDVAALLTLLFWVLVKLPIAMVCFSLGIIFCASLILLPLGSGCFQMVKKLLVA